MFNRDRQNEQIKLLKIQVARKKDDLVRAEQYADALRLELIALEAYLAGFEQDLKENL